MHHLVVIRRRVASAGCIAPAGDRFAASMTPDPRDDGVIPLTEAGPTAGPDSRWAAGRFGP